MNLTQIKQAMPTLHKDEHTKVANLFRLEKLIKSLPNYSVSYEQICPMKIKVTMSHQFGTYSAVVYKDDSILSALGIQVAECKKESITITTQMIIAIKKAFSCIIKTPRFSAQYECNVIIERIDGKYQIIATDSHRAFVLNESLNIDLNGIDFMALPYKLCAEIIKCKSDLKLYYSEWQYILNNVVYSNDTTRCNMNYNKIINVLPDYNKGATEFKIADLLHSTVSYLNSMDKYRNFGVLNLSGVCSLHVRDSGSIKEGQTKLPYITNTHVDKSICIDFGYLKKALLALRTDSVSESVTIKYAANDLPLLLESDGNGIIIIMPVSYDRF